MTRVITYSKEGDVKKRVKKLLDNHEWFWWMPAANGFGQSGVSDICCFRNGIFMAVETKFGKNKPTAQQGAFLRSILQENGFAFVVHERNIDYFEAWLGAFDRSIEAASRSKEPSPEDGAMMLNAIKELQELIV